MATIRYPSEFPTSTSPETDYIKIQFLRRDYSVNTVKYNEEGNTIVLNMPQKITEGLTQNFANSGLGEMGMLNAFSNRQGTQSGINGGALGAALQRAGENQALKSTLELMNKLGASQLSENGILSAAGGVVFNPQLELVYEGPDFRKFNFQFSLFTKSADDAKAIKSIIDELRFQSLPSTGARQTSVGLANMFTTMGGIALGKSLGTATSQTAKELFDAFVAGKTGNTSNFDPTAAINSLAGGLVDAGAFAAAAAGTGVGALFSGNARFIKQPAFLYLQYMRGADRHPFIPSLMPASIDQVNFDFTPTGNYTTLANYAEAKDKTLATTIGVNITLTLTEVTNLFQESLTDNYQPKAPTIEKKS